MKKLFFLIILTSFASFAFAQNYSLQNDPKKPRVSVISSSPNETILEYNFQEFTLSDVQTPNGVKKTVKMQGASHTLVKGEPALLQVANSIIIPDKGDVSLKVLDIDYVDFQDIEIVPSKGNFTRDIDPETVPYTWGRTYQNNDIFPKSPATISDPYILRDYRGAAVKVFPLQYNHKTRSLRAIKTIKIKVVCDNSVAGNNEFIRIKPISKVDENFNELYANQFLNYNTAKYTAIEERGNILVISKPEFVNAMKPYVQWKNRIGFPTKIVSTSVTGKTSAEVANYVKNYYNTNGLTFLLLVGDAQDINPIVTSSGYDPAYSDNAFAYITGNDHYPEFYVGRFSAESIADVDVQVLRTISYEKNPITENNWLNTATGIASSEGSGIGHDGGETDYVHIRKILTRCTDYEYVKTKEFYDGSQGGNDASGNPTPAMVSAGINEGTGILFYCGHGSETSFVSSGFSNTDVNNLNNTNKWPFILSVACVNGDFKGKTCFAEAWLRARKGSNPTGAVATIMSTINQSWLPPMDGQEEMSRILCELIPGNKKHTFGGITISGCMKMNDIHGSAGNDMTDTLTIFGDPSLMIRTDTPKVLTINADDEVLIGMSSINVSCNAENAFITVCLGDSIIGTGIVTGGNASITIGEMTNLDSLFISATKYNYIPAFDTALVIPNSGAYITYSSHKINDATGNNNDLADYGEDITIDLSLKNAGTVNASNIVSTISTTSSYANITDNSENFGNINAGQTVSKSNAYSIKISNEVNDQTTVPIKILATNGSDNWEGQFGFTVNAPKLNIGKITIDDASGNNNGFIDPGETINVKIVSENIGHSPYINATGTLQSNDPLVTVTNETINLETLDENSTVNAEFTINVSSEVAVGSFIHLTYTLGSGFYQVSNVFDFNVGILCEDAETDLSGFEWLNAGNKPWFVTTSNPYEGDKCLQSGAITHQQTSVIHINYNVSRNDSISFFYKVSCESGSTYGSKYDYFDFAIDGVSKQWWDGQTSWKRASFPVNAGERNFRWSYCKDFMASEGQDAAWLDYIVFPPLKSDIGIENADNYSFNIYPNPAKENTFIEINMMKAENATVELYDNYGKLVKVLYNGMLNAGQNKININTNEIAAGAYIVNFKTQSGVSISRMIITSNL